MEPCENSNFVPVFVCDNVMCRLCGCTGNNTAFTLMTEDCYLVQVIKAETNVVITNSDIFPKTVCQNCLEKINLIQHFREHCKETQRVLEQMYTENYNQKIILIDNKIELDNDSEMIIEWKDEDLIKHNETEELERNATIISENNVKNIETYNNSFNNDTISVKEEVVSENTNIVSELLDPLAIPQVQTYSEEIKTETEEEIKQPIIENKTYERVGTEVKEQLLYRLLTEPETSEVKCETNIETIELSEDSSNESSETNDNIINSKQETTNKYVFLDKNNDGQVLTNYSKYLTRSNNKYTCTICAEKFRYQFQAEAHVRQHVEVFPFTCTTCGKNFSSSFLLFNHEKTHDGKKFVCEIDILTFYSNKPVTVSTGVCMYWNCGIKRLKNPAQHFFKFPKDSDRQKRWISHCGNFALLNIDPEKLRRYLICQNHFSQNSFVNRLKKSLVKNAVPLHYRAENKINNVTANGSINTTDSIASSAPNISPNSTRSLEYPSERMTMKVTKTYSRNRNNVLETRKTSKYETLRAKLSPESSPEHFVFIKTE